MTAVRRNFNEVNAMKIIKAKSYQDLSRKAANLISAQVILKPECVLGLATGSTPIGTYRQLVEWYQKDDVDFSRVTTFNLDEYVGLSPENPQSYHAFMRRNLFDHVNLAPERCHVPDGCATDLARACREYDAAIAERGGIDLQLLGIRLIMQARKILLIAEGTAKKRALEQALFGPISAQVPASILQLHPDLTVICHVEE